ncbi:hypothetical protein [Bacillus paralicheniformis]|nr:hypothetical protein [Bacillus paralicheniformis]
MMMKVVSFTGGAAGVYAGLRAIVTGNASGILTVRPCTCWGISPV